MVSEKLYNKMTAKNELCLILPKIDCIFESEPAVLQINTEPIMIVGDIHGDIIGFDQSLLLRINQTFEKMPVAAVISSHTFCIHGGINGTENFDNIEKEESFPYLWNDPSKHPGLTASVRGSTVKEFGPDIVDGFLKTNNLKRIIRGHTALENGYEWWFDGKLLSLFSCPDYVGLGNAGAFSLLENSELRLFVFRKS